jgi:hypothetical protein
MTNANDPDSHTNRLIDDPRAAKRVLGHSTLQFLVGTSHHSMLPTIWFYLAMAAAAAASAAAEEDAFNDTTWTIQKYECKSDCDSGMFCGRDLKCHPYSCETFYALGHPFWTGHDDDPSSSPPPELDCKIVELGQDRSFLHHEPMCKGGYLPSAVYYVSANGDGGSWCAYADASSDPDLFVYMNRKCTGTPSDGYGFVCYDMDPDTDLDAYFADYAAATAGLENIESFDNSTRYPHHYNGQLTAPQISTFTSGSTTEFNVTLANRSMVAELFNVTESHPLSSLLCKNGCKDTEFCGQDGTCHAFNCVNLYDYGPKTATGHDYDDRKAPKLACTNEPPPVEDTSTCLSPWPLLIHYHCTLSRDSDYFSKPVCPVDYLDGRYATLNRYCSAQPNPSQTFSCYDLDPDTITDGMERFLTDYLNKVRLDSECTAENLPERVGDPSQYNESDPYTGRSYHSYQACIDITQWHTNCALVGGAVSPKGTELSPLDFERLRHVMRSNIRGELPPSSSFSSAPTPSPFPLASTANLLGTTKTTTIAAATLTAWLGWIVLS